MPGEQIQPRLQVRVLVHPHRPRQQGHQQRGMVGEFGGRVDGVQAWRGDVVVRCEQGEYRGFTVQQPWGVQPEERFHERPQDEPRPVVERQPAHPGGPTAAQIRPVPQAAALRKLLVHPRTSSRPFLTIESHGPSISDKWDAPAPVTRASWTGAGESSDTGPTQDGGHFPAPGLLFHAQSSPTPRPEESRHGHLDPFGDRGSGRHGFLQPSPLAGRSRPALPVRPLRPHGGGSATSSSGSPTSGGSAQPASYRAYRDRRDQQAKWERRYRRERPVSTRRQDRDKSGK